MVEKHDSISPFLVAGCYYVTVFILGHILRSLARRYLNPTGSLYRILIEAITTTQMCSCVFENAVIVRNYGPLGFFFVVASVLTVGANVNRGGYVSPLTPIELYFNEIMPLRALLEIIIAEAIGGYAAFRVAKNLWFASSHLTVEHLINYANTKCEFSYKVPFIVAFAFEFIGSFLLRMCLARVSRYYRPYIGPLITAAFLAFSLTFVGVVGLNPTVAGSRMFGCEGMSILWFIATYWLCPTAGWMTAAVLDSLTILGTVKSAVKRKQ